MIITVRYERDEDTWIATSPDAAGWIAVADDLVELRSLAIEGLSFYLGRDDLELAEDAEADVDGVLVIAGTPLTFSGAPTLHPNTVATAVNGLREPLPA